MAWGWEKWKKVTVIRNGATELGWSPVKTWGNAHATCWLWPRQLLHKDCTKLTSPPCSIGSCEGLCLLHGHMEKDRRDHCCLSLTLEGRTVTATFPVCHRQSCRHGDHTLPFSPGAEQQIKNSRSRGGVRRFYGRGVLWIPFPLLHKQWVGWRLCASCDPGH